MAKKLIFDLDEITKCRNELDTSKTELEAIQKKLQGAVDTLVDANGWQSDGSSAFVEQYNTSWVEGINDRTAVMQRMISHLDFACSKYEPVETEALALKLDSGESGHGGGGGRRF